MRSYENDDFEMTDQFALINGLLLLLETLLTDMSDILKKGPRCARRSLKKLLRTMKGGDFDKNDNFMRGTLV